MISASTAVQFQTRSYFLISSKNSAFFFSISRRSRRTRASGSPVRSKSSGVANRVSIGLKSGLP
jgi:hypothetical protein